MKNNPLHDSQFLLELDKFNNKELFVRIIALDKKELPVEQIEGKATGGSINIDGTSSLRRTCNLSLVAKDIKLTDYYWGLKNKFKLEIGLKNIINPKYDDIIWFKMGTYVITSFNSSKAVNNFTINISGKDKMCLLNGDLSGSLPHTTDFGIEEDYDKTTNTTTYTVIPIKTIIREAVQNFGGELAHNIIINDVEDNGLELLEYRGNTPLYLFKDISTGNFTNMSINGDQGVFIIDKEIINSGLVGRSTEVGWGVVGEFPDLKENDLDKLKEENDKRENKYELTIVNIDSSLSLDGTNLWDLRKDPEGPDGELVYDTLLGLDPAGEIKPTQVVFRHGGKVYNIVKIEYGDLVGYRETDLVYAGDLIANVGETLTSVLDKIRDMLGEFEYFYDLDGRFIFRKKPYFVETPWTLVEKDEKDQIFEETASTISEPLYRFNGSNLITAMSNNPNILNLRNDFSTWGTHKTSAGAEIPIHMRYAIDKKPVYYKPIRSLWTREKNSVEEPPQEYLLYEKKAKNEKIELMYELEWIDSSNKEEKIMVSTYLNPFSTDLEFFSEEERKKINFVDWREIIYQMALDYRKGYHDDNFLYDLAEANKLNGTYLYPDGHTGYEQYYVDMEEFWRTLYNPIPEVILENSSVEKLKDATEVYVKNYHKKATKNDLLNIDLEEVYVLEDDTFLPFIDAYCHQLIFNNDKNKPSVYYEISSKGISERYTFWKGDFGAGTEYKNEYDWFVNKNIRNLYIKWGEETLKDLFKFSEDNPNLKVFQTIDRKWLSVIKDKDNIQSSNIEDYNIFGISTNEERSVIVKDEQHGELIQFIYFLFFQLINTGKLYIKNSNVIKNFKDLDEEVKKVYQKNEEFQQYFEWNKTNNFGKHPSEKPTIKTSGEGENIVIESIEWSPAPVDEETGEIKFEKEKEKINYYFGYYEFTKENNWWTNKVFEAPDSLIFWFDFLDAEGSNLAKYSVPTIGTRSKSIKDNNVKTIIYRDIPNIIFKTYKDSLEADRNTKPGYTWLQLPRNMENLFVISNKGKSAKERTDELLYNHSYCIDSINLTSIPVYYLEPNIRIEVQDDENNINGEYIISRLSYNLTHNGTMQITATKAVDSLK